ncbi:MAG: hypothetical protein C6I01_01035 [Epsilonproteobacteria bacterium]|jgi:GTP-binding protein EngB required for normal cell division|nr:hypothetical protein [Campylobacterota bacterium]NPA89245.1 GTPase/DUF3482 domain-containing protein [Campylobacterota bacterium]
MREYKAPKIAFIGKPNNGKSSIISVLTMDDRIKISREAGTTTQVNEYEYKDRKNNTIATFYDTPGFEHPKRIHQYLKEHSLKDTIKYLKELGYRKDVSILEAIKESDILCFVVDSSSQPDLNTHGYEIEILKLVNKNTIVVLNPHKEPNKNKEWEKFLSKLGLQYVIEFNPLKSGFQQIKNFFQMVEKYYPDIQELKKWHKEDFNSRLNRSFDLIAQKVYEIVTYEYKGKVDDKKSVAQLKELYFQELNRKEQELKKELKELWGYYETEVIDTYFKIEDKQFSKEIGFSRTTLVVLGALAGLAISVIDGGVTLATFLSATLAGGVVGASIKQVTDKFSNTVTFKLDERKGFFVMLTVILRNMEFLDALLNHGHANREPIRISNDIKKWKYRVDIFNKSEKKFLNYVFKSFIKNSNVIESKERLKTFLLRKFPIFI